MPRFNEPSVLTRYAQFGPLDSLHGALRQAFPQVSVARVRKPSEFVAVDCRRRGPWRVCWEDGDELFIWASGPDKDKPVGTLIYVDRTAQRIARLLGLPTDVLRC
ncbi:hypothetical protein [Actinomadura rugatobispora]|uniref:Uncharacterized protein n=1 Tax=Actinomadura rugatobispora TaxID=1994 RepID=A0ABW0ZVU6_9ACTN|nr:hypothetical protein GCM10010200_050140 [Actinomadura rugatobispora]